VPTHTPTHVGVSDGAGRVRSGTVDRTERDTFMCPVSGTLMREPVKLVEEPEGWSYERTALQRLLKVSGGRLRLCTDAPCSDAVLTAR
jgi:hypothetical protein